MLVCVVLWCLFLVALTYWERADLLAVVFLVFCIFTKYVLVHIRIKDKVGAVKLVY